MLGEIGRFDLGAALLRNAHGDLQTFMAGLEAKLNAALMGSVVVTYHHYGMFFRKRRITSIVVMAGPDHLKLALDGNKIEASVARIVSGVRIGTKAITVQEWFERLSAYVEASGEGAEEAREAIYRFLVK